MNRNPKSLIHPASIPCPRARGLARIYFQPSTRKTSSHAVQVFLASKSAKWFVPLFFGAGDPGESQIVNTPGLHSMPAGPWASQDILSAFEAGDPGSNPGGPAPIILGPAGIRECDTSGPERGGVARICDLREGTEPQIANNPGGPAIQSLPGPPGSVEDLRSSRPKRPALAGRLRPQRARCARSFAVPAGPLSNHCRARLGPRRLVGRLRSRRARSNFYGARFISSASIGSSGGNRCQG